MTAREQARADALADAETLRLIISDAHERWQQRSQAVYEQLAAEYQAAGVQIEWTQVRGLYLEAQGRIRRAADAWERELRETGAIK